MYKIREYRGIVAKIAMVTLVGSLLASPLSANAAQVTSFSDNLSRLKANTPSNHEIKFVTPSGAAAGQTITFTFQSDFTGVSSITSADIDFAEGSSNDCSAATFTEKTLAASATGATWGAAASGQVVTLTSGTGTVTANRCLRIRIGTNAVTGSTGTNQISNGPSDDDDTITVGGTFGDSGVAYVDIITDDQVAVTATVDPTITFTINDNSIGFGTLSANNVRYATGDTTGSSSETSAHNLTAATNATSGYVMYVQGPTLTSGANTITAIGGTAMSSTPGSEQFGIRLAASGGSGTTVSPYNSGSQYAYAANATTQDDIAQATAPSLTTTYNAYYLANISAITEAGLYATTLTYTATATY